LKYSKTFFLGVVNGVLFNMSEALIGGTTVLPIFVSNITSSKVLIGLSGTMSMAGWFLPQLVVANLIETIKRKRPIYFWSGVVRIVTIWTIALSVPLVRSTWAGSFLVLFFLLYSIYVIAGGVAGIPFMDIVGKEIKSQNRGSFFGARLFFGGIVAALAGLFVKDVIANRPFPYDYATLFITASAVITVAIISFCLADEREGTVFGRRTPFRKFLRRGPLLLKDIRSYRMFLMWRVLLGIWMMALPFYIIYARERLALPEESAGVFLSIQMVGMVISNLLWGRLSDRIGNKIVLNLTALVSAASPAIALLTTVAAPLRGMFTFGTVFFFLGFTMSGLRLGHSNYMLDLSPESERPTYLGFMNTFLAPVMLLSAVGGLLVEKTSFEVLFVVALGAGAVAFLFATQLEEPRRQPGQPRRPKTSIPGHGCKQT
jgi:MFS family permease